MVDQSSAHHSKKGIRNGVGLGCYRRATELADHGVNPAFVNRFKELGFADISLRKAEELADHGVTTEFIKKMQDKGLKNLSLDEYIRLRDAGM